MSDLLVQCLFPWICGGCLLNYYDSVVDVPPTIVPVFLCLCTRMMVVPVTQ